MSNMSYCRFENTARDLADCEEALSEMIDAPADCGNVNSYEMAAAPRLFDSAANLLEMLADVMGASIVVTDSEGGECDLSQFDWEEAFKKVQSDITAAHESDEEEA